MIVPLIPFFLVTNMSYPGMSTCTRGPEVEFDLSVFDRLSPLVEEMGGDNVNLTLKLGCRPKEQRTLRCAIHSGSITSQSIPDGEITHRPIIEKIWFEIIFNENGVDNLIVEAAQSCRQTNLLTRIASLLSVGADLKNKEHDFVESDDFAMGRCKNTAFHVETIPDDADDVLEPTPELDVIPMSIPEGNYKMKLTKVRNMESCNGTDEYFDYMRKRGTTMSVTSSKSEMTIGTAGTFESYSENHGEMKDMNGQMIATAEEVFRIKLNSIKRASEDMPEYDNPRIVGFAWHDDCWGPFLH